MDAQVGSPKDAGMEGSSEGHIIHPPNIAEYSLCRSVLCAIFTSFTSNFYYLPHLLPKLPTKG